MIQTVFNGAATFVVNDPPTLTKGYQAEFSCVVDEQSSLTKRETRRSYSETLRVAVKCASVVSNANLRTLLGQLRQLKAQQVLIPFWPAVSFWSSRASMKITGGLLVAFKRDWSQYEIYEAGSEPGWPSDRDLVAPAMIGYLEKNEPRFQNGSQALWQIVFDESDRSDYALQFSPTAWGDGPKPAGYVDAPKMFPYRQDFRSSTDGFRFDMARDNFGFNRDRSGTVYPHEVYRAQSAQFTLSGSARIADFISFFQQNAAQGFPFWIPSSLESARLAAPAGIGATALTVTGSEALQVNDWVCVFTAAGPSFAQIQTIVGDTVNLVAPFGVALGSGAQIFALNLAEFSGVKLTVKWLSPELAIASFSWTEVRAETLIPGGETVGLTIGRLKRRIILFHFFRDYGNGTVTHQYFTNYERDVSWNGNTYSVAPFDLEEITKSLNLQDDSCSISSSMANFDGSLFVSNPLIQELAISGEVPLSLEVHFSEVDSSAVLDAGGGALSDAGGDALFI